MVKILRKVLLVLLLSNNCFAQECKPSLYKFKDENLCFSSKLKSYLTKNCDGLPCGALVLVEKSKTLDRSTLPKSDSRHAGAKSCLALGGATFVVTSEKTQDQLCLCVAQDQSGVSCNRLGLQ